MSELPDPAKRELRFHAGADVYMPDDYEDYFTADQMRAYAMQAVLLERGRHLDLADKARELLDANQMFLQASTRATLRSEAIPADVTVRAALADAALRSCLSAVDAAAIRSQAR